MAQPEIALEGQRSRWIAALHIFTVGMLVVVVLVGKASLGRFVPGLGALENIDLRLLALIASVLGLATTFALTRTIDLRMRAGRAAIFGTPIGLLFAYILVGGARIWETGAPIGLIVDMTYFFITPILCIFVVRSERDLSVAAFFVEAAAFCLWYASGLGLGPTDYAGQMATTITSYRVYGVGMCAALYLSMHATPLGWRLLHSCLAAGFAFLCLASTSKTGLVAVGAVVGTLIVGAALFRRWMQIAGALVLLAVGTAAFAFSPYSDVLVARIAAVSPSATSISVEEHALDGSGPRQATGCTESQLAAAGKAVAVRRDSCGNLAVIPDGSQRLRLAFHAVNLFSGAPIWGAGPNGFQLLLAEDNSAPVIYTYPHNVFLEVAAAYGLVGLVLLTSSFLLCLIAVSSALQRRYETIYFVCIASLICAGSFTGGDLYDARLVWFVIAMLVGVYGFGGTNPRSWFSKASESDLD